VKTSELISTQPTPVDSAHNAIAAVADEVVKPVDTPASTPIGISDAEFGAIISQWQGYGFSTQDKTYLKYTRLPTTPTTSLFGLLNNNSNMVTLNGKSYNIGIQWGPDVCNRARIVGEIHMTPAFTGWFGLTGLTNATQRLKLAEYYGVGLPLTQYISLNAKRKAELMELADKIANLERTTGKLY
jgi:hypothetical protein